MSTWYVQSNGESVGPLDGKGMEALVANGRLRPGSPICTVGATSWSRADSDPLIAGLFATPSAAPPGPGWDIFGTAKYHRLFLIAILGNIAITVALVIWPRFGSGESPGFPVASTIILILALGETALIIVLNSLLQRSMRTHVALSVLTSVLLLAPCVSLVTMYAISQLVQKRFTALGISVGFMGVKRAQLIEAGFVPPER